MSHEVPLPLLKPVLENVPAASFVEPWNSLTEGRELPELETSSDKAAGTSGTSQTSLLSTDTSSSSRNGEVARHKCRQQGDFVMCAPEKIEQVEERRGGSKTPVELPISPQRAIVRSAEAGDNVIVLSPSDSVHREEEHRDEAYLWTTPPVHSVWMHQVGVDPSFTTEGSSPAILSDAAAFMIAHALHRFSLLRRCFTQWQVRRAHRVQYHLHRECFADGYYQRNVLYLFFRAWQWRHHQHLRSEGQRHMLEYVRVRHLRRRVFLAWRGWNDSRRLLQARLSAIQALAASSFRRRCFEQWRRTSRLRVLARAAARVSGDRLRSTRFHDWLRLLLQRKGERLRVDALALHTPAAWASAHMRQFDGLCFRHVWIQWLRVAMHRRASRLHVYEGAMTIVREHRDKTMGRRWYVRWLQMTYISLHEKHARHVLLQRYYRCWSILGARSQMALHWEKRSHCRHVQRRCLTRWCSRFQRRRDSREHLRMAECFFYSVVQEHVTRAVFRAWLLRHSRRAKAQRMRRVAAEYARPALLRHLFLLHVADGVLESPLEIKNVLKLDGQRSGSEATLLQPTSIVTSSNENSTREERRRAAVLGSPRPPRPPIPFHNCRRSSSGGFSGPRATGDDAAESAPGSTRGGEGCAEAVTTISAPGPVTATETPLPPPPSYEEVMSLSPATGQRSLIGGRALPVRVDAGVGTTFEVPRSLHVDTRVVGCTGDPLIGYPHVYRQAEEDRSSAMATAFCHNTPHFGVANVWPLAGHWHVDSSGAPVTWTPSITRTGRSGRLPLDTIAQPSTFAAVYGCAPPACPSVYSVPWTGDLSSSVIKPPTVASAGRACAEAVVEAPAFRHVAEAPEASTSPAFPLLSEGFYPETPSPLSHCSFDTHRHADGLALRLHLRNGAAAQTFERDGGGPLPDPGGYHNHNASPLCVGRPAEAPGSAILSKGRVSLSFVGGGVGKEKQQTSNISTMKAPQDALSAHLPPLSSSSSSSSSLSSRTPRTFAGPRARDAGTVPLCCSSSTEGSCSLRAQARDVLSDFKSRTRLVAAEKAELAAVESQLEMSAHLQNNSQRKELSRRRTYLRRRILEWEQRRAQVAQLAVWLEDRVSATTSSAVSDAGAGRLE